MKYRSDFVTNSSSSSFIVVFNSKKGYEERLKTMLSKGVSSEYACRIHTDIENNKVSKEKVLDLLQYCIKSAVEFDLLYKDRNYSYSEMEKIRNTKEFQEEVSRRVNEKLEETKKRLPKRGYYAILEYGDEDGCFFSTLEHDIMPYLPFTFYTLNNH